MTGSNLPRRYDEKEVARILKRATEIRREKRPGSREEEGDGLTLQELEEIAAEAGIDVAHLRQAALEVDLDPPDSGWARVAGAELTVTAQAEVEGELTEEGFQQVVATLQSTLKEPGHPSLMARILTWRNEVAKSGGRSTMVSVACRGGRTTVRVEENLQQVAGAFHGGITAGGGMGIGMGFGLPMALATGSVLLGVAFPLGVIGAGYVISRGSYRIYVDRRRRAVAHLLGRLVDTVEAEVQPAGGTLPGGPERALPGNDPSRPSAGAPGNAGASQPPPAPPETGAPRPPAPTEE